MQSNAVECSQMQSNAVECGRMQSNAARVASSEINEVYLDAKLLFGWQDSEFWIWFVPTLRKLCITSESAMLAFWRRYSSFASVNTAIVKWDYIEHAKEEFAPNVGFYISIYSGAIPAGSSPPTAPIVTIIFPAQKSPHLQGRRLSPLPSFILFNVCLFSSN